MAAYAGSGGKASLILHLAFLSFYTFYPFRENNSYNDNCHIPHCVLFRLWVAVWSEINFTVAILFTIFASVL
jgi:hypothetical protein